MAECSDRVLGACYNTQPITSQHGSDSSIYGGYAEEKLKYIHAWSVVPAIKQVKICATVIAGRVCVFSSGATKISGKFSDDGNIFSCYAANLK